MKPLHLTILLILAAFALQVDVLTMICPAEMPAPEDPVRMTTDERNALLEEYRSAAAEIRGRISEENTLFSFKFTLVGAILALLLAETLRTKAESDASPGEQFRRLRSPLAACFLWAAVITSAIIDTRIEYHVGLIKTLGDWVRLVVEPTLLAEEQGWEHFLSNSSLMTSRLYPLLRSNVHLLTLVLFVLGILTYRKSSRLGSEQALGESTAWICRAGCWGTILVFAIAGLHNYHARSGAFLVVPALLVLFAMYAASKLWPTGSPESPSSRGVAG